ncbi:electron transport complex protein RnfD [Luminiphilus syltensis NOR5-1B]|uniref:Ion-translocating oxidoreductase complex subunit D n=1 Tax=Luminiphilus syltensis NOR5-1B TaxID=565045 RepID=B8KQD9_9GAMM|nr:electron transport complex subunit RsxD [Luminiphilus syltensis]EED35027.1 electron transport complex protein RnfD [Luminiphilus syltensis NOR5-1B]
MGLLTVTSPHAHGPQSVTRVMRAVLLATLPGVAVMTYFFGPGTLLNIIAGGLVALALEGLVMRLRQRQAGPYLRDYSVLVTSTLLCIALPAYTPWWIVAVGVASSVLLGKHVFGGLGYNPFNPAMVGYVVLLISFPVQMSAWPAPRGLAEVPSLGDSFVAFFQANQYDGITMATPLDLLRQNQGELMSELTSSRAQFGALAGVGWEWINIAFLAGGLWLLYQRIFTWHAPVAMLAALTLSALLGYDGGSSTSGGPVMVHLLSGATIFGAFFIITDPVSSAVSNRGRLIFGAAIGVLVYLIRAFGNYPDALAFAVLIMNFAAPFIDHYTQPRVYGQGDKR